MKARARALLVMGLLGLGGGSLSAACSETATITDVFVSLDSDGARRRKEFFTDTAEIHCVVEAVIGRPGVTVEVAIRQVQRYDEASRAFTNADRVLGYAEGSPPPSNERAKLPVKLTKRKANGEESDEAPYPAGRYQCEVLLDGEAQAPVAFNVRFPPCPPAQIRPGSQCIGFYEDGRECPTFGESSKEADRCTCQVAGWSCR